MCDLNLNWVAKNDYKASIRELLLLSGRPPLLQVLMYRSSEPLSVNASEIAVMVMVMVSLPLLLLCAYVLFHWRSGLQKSAKI